MFRNYQDCDKRVEKLYRLQRQNQHYDYAGYMIDKYCRFEEEGYFWDLFEKAGIMDVSDPDLENGVSNTYHFWQAAEGIRKAGLPDWMQVVGLVHDMGKLLCSKPYACNEDGTSVTSQWGVVGDTFITGTEIPNSVVFPDFNSLNVDHQRGMMLDFYKNGCGLDQMRSSFGHDEYMYRLLKINGVKLPDQAYAMIRYHSMYAWHQGGSYLNFENTKDRQMKPWVRLFNQYDLYTKVDDKEKLDSLDERIETEFKPYYTKLLEKYFPEGLILKW
jgi:inositol oxygenase